MAAGITIKSENIPALINIMNEFAHENAQYMSEPPSIEIDAVISPDEITPDVCEMLSRLEPFGTGNTQPVLCVRGLHIDMCTKVGDAGKHLKILFSADTKNGRHITLNGIAFSQGAYEHIVNDMDDMCSVICKAEINSWQGRENISLIVSDVFDGDYNIDNGLKCVYNSDYVTDGGFSLERKILAVMYKQLLSIGDNFKFSDLYRVRSNMRKSGIICTWYEIRNGLDVFTELGLIKRTDKQNYTILKPEGKTELSASDIYRRAQVVR